MWNSKHSRIIFYTSLYHMCEWLRCVFILHHLNFCGVRITVVVDININSNLFESMIELISLVHRNKPRQKNPSEFHEEFGSFWTLVLFGSFWFAWKFNILTHRYLNIGISSFSQSEKFINAKKCTPKSN